MTARRFPTRRPLRGLVWVVAAALLLALPVAGARVDALSPSAATAAKSDWTMMIYAVGDTSNVPESMVRNLNLIADLPDADNVDIVALVDLPERSDRSAPRSEIRGIGQFTTAKLMVLHDHKWNEIRDLGEKSLGRPDVLAQFIHEAADRFPASKYGLTLFDHGGGYQGGYIDNGPPSEGLSIPEMRAGIAAGMQAAGIPRFELLYHAACLMSSYETVSALAPLAKTMAGSEEIMVSTPILPGGYALMARNASGAQVGAALNDSYGTFLEQLDAKAASENTRALAAMSVIDSDRVRGLDLAIEAFARAAQAHAAEVAPAVTRARAKVLEFVIALDTDQDSWDLVDLGDFLRNLGPLPQDVAVARDAVYAALRSAVSHQVTGKATQQATGLNVYLPTSPDSVGTYLRDGTAPRGWGAFLGSFLGSVTAARDGKPDAQFAAARPRLELLPNGVRLTGQLRTGDGARAVTSRTQVLADMAGFRQAIAVITPGYLGAGGADQVQGVWSYETLALSDGRATVPLSASFRAQTGGLVGSAYARYTSPTGSQADVSFRLLLDSAGQIRAVSPTVISADGSAAGTQLETGGTLHPVVAVQTPSGFDTRVASGSVKIGPRTQIVFSRLPSGTPFSIGLVVGDVGDQRDVTFADGRVR